MGVAAYQRGNALISRQVNETRRPVEFDAMDALCDLPKYPDAGTPFGPIHFSAGNGGWWAECPITGFGYWYPTLREAVRRWHVMVIGYDATRGAWLSEPMEDAS